MSVFDRVTSSLRRAVLLDERIKVLSKEVEALESQVSDHEGRLIRIETMIEMGQRGGLSPRLDD